MAKRENTALELFHLAAARYAPQAVAEKLGLHVNTVQRWRHTGKVPDHYRGDFSRMLGGRMLGEDAAVDKFYTKKDAARQCYEKFLQTAARLNIELRGCCFIEPAAGGGAFYDLLPPRRRIGLDIAPAHRRLIQADYLRWQPPKKRRYIVIGNPPFGLRGHLALQFINHSSRFADMVAFILPQLFDSDGKGVPSKRVDRRLKLAYSQRLPPGSFIRPHGEPIDISTVFQVWTGVHHDAVTLPPRKTAQKFIKVYSLSNGGTPSSTRNKHMIGKCDMYLPSTCFSGMRAYRAFEELPHCRGYGLVIQRQKKAIARLLGAHQWARTAFPSTNGALNLRTSLIEEVVIAAGFYD